MIDFTKLTGIEHDGKVVTQIEDSAGSVLWAVSGGKVILEVEKITSDTYAGETTYTGEQFILLDIYPKTNGTVKVTYGGLTKTITDTSGAEEPNAQQVFFGTFNGVADDVVTPTSDRLIIEGDYYGFGNGNFSKGKLFSDVQTGNIVKVINFGEISMIPDGAFESNLIGMANRFATHTVNIPKGVTSIGNHAFRGCSVLETVVIPAGVTKIGAGAFAECSDLKNIVVSSENKYYCCEDGVLFNRSKTEIVAIAGGVNKGAYTIPNGISSIATRAFEGYNKLDSVVIPETVKFIGKYAFYICSPLNTVTFIETVNWKAHNTSTNSWIDLDVTDATENAKMLKASSGSEQGIHDWERIW